MNFKDTFMKTMNWMMILGSLFLNLTGVWFLAKLHLLGWLTGIILVFGAFGTILIYTNWITNALPNSED